MARLNTCDYIEIDTTGNATDFGDLTVARSALCGCDNNSRGIIAGGSDPSVSNVIGYIEIDTTGNATDFGDLTVARSTLGGGSGD